MAKNNHVKIHIQRVYESLLRDIIQYPPNTHLFPSPPPPNPIPIPSPHSPPSPHLLIPQSPTMHLNSPPPPQTSSRLSLPTSHLPLPPKIPTPSALFHIPAEKKEKKRCTQTPLSAHARFARHTRLAHLSTHSRD